MSDAPRTGLGLWSGSGFHEASKHLFDEAIAYQRKPRRSLAPRFSPGAVTQSAERGGRSARPPAAILEKMFRCLQELLMAQQWI